MSVRTTNEPMISNLQHSLPLGNPSEICPTEDIPSRHLVCSNAPSEGHIRRLNAPNPGKEISPFINTFSCFIQHASSMIKGVLGQPNFSPQTNTTQLFPQINTNFNNLSSVKVNTNISSCVKLDERNKFEFSVKKEQKVLNY